MTIYPNPPRQEWPTLVQRPAKDLSTLRGAVGGIMDYVKARGDAALLELTSRFDGLKLEELRVSDATIAAAAEQLTPELRAAIQLAKANIERFHLAQREQASEVETMPGVTCWRESRGIDRVGLYIPGGTAPLFSTVLMLAVPAQIAGCGEVVLCSPPNRTLGDIHPAVLYAAGLCGVTKIFRVGGAQAIAAMAYGTETVPAVYKIFGPGNAYVTVAKQLAQLEGLAIDMPAGPSEVLVGADAGAKPAWVAADLLAQAEHGDDSQVVLVVASLEQGEAIKSEVLRQLEDLPRREMAAAAIANSLILVLPGRQDQLDFINAYAPEHLILCRADARDFAAGISNAGSIFLGYHTPESVGDYASGTNHTLPTYGYARNYSGVSLDSFVKKITFQELTVEGLRQVGPAVVTMAEAEALRGHARAVTLRLSDL
ncbi:histidinol dehydrogenase [Neolewinella lacunae]|uniref:Histidinol dehydrogenase n=1 Tax=Neolewinella lacunae TaxID=1517758 RepID=A0A923PLJ7_9BACT|nr:histidinol dehydrogenase [Neolewinella lacunae]MBC6995639.1 histidinol dehydrogenase [Neolewinella lacunae]MDN3634294.1 histidinol dehydrogenase [Neolewinella lacunae]